MAGDKFFMYPKDAAWCHPEAEIEGANHVVLYGRYMLTFEEMSKLCSWWIQYIAEHPQPEVNSVTEEK